MGVLIPKEAVRKLNLKPEEEICIEIKTKKPNVLRDMFGTSEFKKAKEIVKEIRKNESKYI